MTTPESHKISSKKYCDKNRDALNLKSKEYRIANPNVRKETQRRYRENNKDKVLSHKREYRKSHPERVRELYEKNIEKILLNAKNQKYKRRGAEGKLSLGEWKSVLDKYGHKCLWCGRGDVKLTIDHVKPISAGGTNTVDNVQPLCFPCNSAKHTKTMDFRPDMS